RVRGDAGQASVDVVFTAVEAGAGRQREGGGGRVPAGDDESVLEACGMRVDGDALPAWRGREALVERALGALAAGSVTLVGPGGAGKTALIREMARRIAA